MILLIFKSSNGLGAVSIFESKATFLSTLPLSLWERAGVRVSAKTPSS